MDLTLRPMSTEDLASYLAVTTEEYIAELVRAGRTQAEAEQNSAESMKRSFADGVPINGNEVFSVLEGEHAVGVLWIAPRDGTNFWWIYDIELTSEVRGRGLGRSTMLLAEAAVRERGGTELGLNVFGHNAIARGLYESLGYQPTSIQMRKPL